MNSPIKECCIEADLYYMCHICTKCNAIACPDCDGNCEVEDTNGDYICGNMVCFNCNNDCGKHDGER